MPNPNNIEQKFKPGDRVSVSKEALETLEDLFPDGFETTDGTVAWVRADMTYPESVLVDYIYTVRLDENPNVPNLQFTTAELTMVLPVAIKQLDIIIRDMENQVAVLRTYRNSRAKELGFD